jgi:hypothetical protein
MANPTKPQPSLVMLPFGLSNPPSFLILTSRFETPLDHRHIAMGNILTYPASRGSIHVTSPTDVYTRPDFQAGHLSHPADAAAVVWAYKKTYEIARRMPAYVAEVAGPDIPEPMPGARRVYSKEDDALIEKWVRERVDTCFHPGFLPIFSVLTIVGLVL